MVALRPHGREAASPVFAGAGAARRRALQTFLITDIVASTEHAVRLGDDGWLALLDQHDALVKDASERCGGRVIRHRGDGVLAAFDTPAAAVECAFLILDGVAGLGIEVRAGVHTGECEVSVGDVRGIAVSVGARVSDLAGAGEVLVSGTVRDLMLGSRVAFADRGAHVLKGLGRAWPLFAAVGGTEA